MTPCWGRSPVRRLFVLVTTGALPSCDTPGCRSLITVLTGINPRCQLVVRSIFLVVADAPQSLLAGPSTARTSNRTMEVVTVLGFGIPVAFYIWFLHHYTLNVVHETSGPTSPWSACLIRAISPSRLSGPSTTRTVLSSPTSSCSQ